MEQNKQMTIRIVAGELNKNFFWFFVLPAFSVPYSADRNRNSRSYFEFFFAIAPQAQSETEIGVVVLTVFWKKRKGNIEKNGTNRTAKCHVGCHRSGSE